MGNNSSKPAKSGSQNGSSRPPNLAFARTDTQGSSRSIKSFASRRSIISTRSDADSFKSARSGQTTPLQATTPGGGQFAHPDQTITDMQLAPGPSILAPPTVDELANGASGFPAMYQPAVAADSADQSGAQQQEQVADGSVTPVRPYHRRTYSSNSIIGGHLVSDDPPASADGGLARSADDASTDTTDTTNTTSSVNTKSSTSTVSSSAGPGTPKPEALSIATANLQHVNSPLASPMVAGSRAERKLGLHAPSFGAASVNNSRNTGGITLNIDEVITRLLEAGYRGRTSKHVCLKNNEIALICQTAREIFLAQPMVLDLSPPVKVVGDVHGQYGDLIRMFDMCGYPPASNYLFLGDYVDRGKQSLETILLLLCYKIKYPENFFLLRGNHECANVTRVYGFYDECKRRCTIKTWKIFIDTFNTLPIAAIVAHKIFCVHGGLSPSLSSINELRSIQRPTDVPDYGLLNDILWSDPADTENEWEDNERGVSYCFNKIAINKFLAKFGFDLVCRAHIVVEDGYEFFNERTLVTVFSAPNYCGEFDNWGAVMSVSSDLLCSFELLKPLDSMALRQEMQKSGAERRQSAMAMAVAGAPGAAPQSV